MDAESDKRIVLPIKSFNSFTVIGTIMY